MTGTLGESCLKLVRVCKYSSERAIIVKSFAYGSDSSMSRQCRDSHVAPTDLFYAILKLSDSIHV